MAMLIEFMPLAVFFAVFFAKDIYAALIALMIAMPIALLLKYLRTKTLDKMLFWSTLLLLVAGSLTLYFRNPLFLYWKPTVFYWAVAIAFVVSQFVGEQPLIKRAFGLVDGLSFSKATDQHWARLNFAWALLFIFLGALNIYVAYNYEEATWVKFKVIGLTALTFVFLLGQSLWLASLMGDDDNETESS